MKMQTEFMFTIISSLRGVFTVGKLGYVWLKDYRKKKQLERDLAKQELEDLKLKVESLALENTSLKEKHQNQLQVVANNHLLFTEHEILFHDIFFSSDFLLTVHERVEEIFKKTRADRFLILFAINGKTDFNYVSACYEMGLNNNIIGATKRYQKFEIDDSYRLMLKRVEKEKSVIYDVSQMEDCLLKTVYESPEEMIHHSIIKFIARVKINNGNDAIVYTSIATKNLEPFSKNELILIKYNSDQIKDGASNIMIN